MFVWDERRFAKTMDTVERSVEQACARMANACESAAATASKAASDAADGVHVRPGVWEDEGPTWRDRRAERREARWRARAARWEAKRARRAKHFKSGPLGWAACYWWLIFPIVFAGPALVDELSAEMTGFGAAVAGGVEGLMHLSPAGPLAEFIASGTGLTFSGAFMMLAAAAAVSAGAAIVALKAPRARPRA